MLKYVPVNLILAQLEMPDFALRLLSFSFINPVCFHGMLRHHLHECNVYFGVVCQNYHHRYYYHWKLFPVPYLLSIVLGNMPVRSFHLG